MKCVFNGTIDSTPPDLCQGVVFIEPHDVIQTQLIEFDSEIAVTVIGALLGAFVTGHVFGRVIRWLGKR
ncbi:hypothetical protein DYB13_17740 [Vibrio cholerae]|nr:hypothetical protein [Vibrio cholerae]EGR2436885.1 hypothetical protein [Vibrio cholerae]EGR2476103.1 hypothetical protein [Vibrio cholerae]KFD82740.1 hypothetical protein DN41_3487 [Vibrio cholerae]GHZ60944.1 hypothetical protein VCSRO80_2494 [Vibrio cholerae]